MHMFKGLQYFPVRHRRQIQGLVVEGNTVPHPRILQLESGCKAAGSANSAAAVDMSKQEEKVSFVDLTEEIHGDSDMTLQDEDTCIVSTVGVHEQDAGTTRVSHPSALIPCSAACGSGCSPSTLEYRESREGSVCGLDLESDDSSVVTTIRYSRSILPPRKPSVRFRLTPPRLLQGGT